MRLLALGLSLLLLLSAGCGGSEDDAREVLAETAANLGQIESGELALELVFTAKGGEEAGFGLVGPFSLKEGPLVAGELDYTRFGNGRGQTATFLSTGERAFVRVAGTAYELPPETTAELRQASGALEAGGLRQLDLTNWLRDPEVEDGGEVGGADTDLVTAELEVAEVLNTLLLLAAQLGGGPEGSPLEGESAEKLEAAVESSRIQVWTGADDRLLRKLELAIDFGVDAEPEIRDALGAGVRFNLALSDPNAVDVSVEPPADARPYSDLG